MSAEVSLGASEMVNLSPAAFGLTIPHEECVDLVWQPCQPMLIHLRPAQPEDVPALVELRALAAAALTIRYGRGPWSAISTERGLHWEMRTATVFAICEGQLVVGCVRVGTRKPWAIDPDYFTNCSRPLYLTSMIIVPEKQGCGIGRACLEQIEGVGRRWPADFLRLDAYDAPAGAGAFYRRCGFAEVGRATYRGTPLIYLEKPLGPAAGEGRETIG